MPAKPKSDPDRRAMPGAVERKPKKTRAEKAAENRARLIRAAQEVIGEHGYADASVSRIVERANLAQGTFYLYFDSRQDLFDQLLPEVGDEALAYVRDAVAVSKNFVEMEARGLRAFFEYAARNPAFFRVLSEAEVAAPEAHRKYTQKRTNAFVKALTQAWQRGEIAGYERRELGVLAQVMLAARAYLFHEYARTGRGVRVPPKWVIDAYLRFVAAGISGDHPASAFAPSPGATMRAVAESMRRPTSARVPPRPAASRKGRPPG